ncbi:MAG TPA: hypothetical protein VMF06_12975 [Candidatus Limnocylindria bacterium]|nr:hypothetical protein [Candidatus Limnocylindria bacterium]
MKHVFFFAVPQEQNPFLARLKRRGLLPVKVAVNGLAPLAQVRQVDELTLVVTGMGPVHARKTAERILEAGENQVVWTCGYAGGLNPELGVGAVVYSADAGFPFQGGLAAGLARQARLVTIDTVAVSRSDKAALRSRSGADAVDMESAIIREIAALRGIPSATVRTVSDTADQDLPLDFNALSTSAGGIHPFKLALALIGAPQKIPRLIRFGGETARAAEALAEVLEKALFHGQGV